MNKRYRIRSSTIAIHSFDGRRVTVHVPEDAVVTIREDPRDGDRLIDVVWNDKNYLMFTQDLRDRGEPLDEKGAST
ncbi:MAG TPA: hypothetical protein VGG72_15440 [Bryobacteraceae bacterium]|jgi:hypothetical protein